MPKPTQLAHIVLKTYDVETLRTWYCDLLEAHVVFEQLPAVSLITYDEEHHRLGIAAQPGEPVAADKRAPGMMHMAFTYGSIRDLLAVYVKMRERGVRPAFTVNHGPTVSFYYEDPDANSVELQVDRFGGAAEAQQFIDRVFDRNPVGVACDPEDLLSRAAAGESDEKLMAYDMASPPLKHPF